MKLATTLNVLLQSLVIDSFSKLQFKWKTYFSKNIDESNVLNYAKILTFTLKNG